VTRPPQNVRQAQQLAHHTSNSTSRGARLPPLPTKSQEVCRQARQKIGPPAAPGSSSNCIGTAQQGIAQPSLLRCADTQMHIKLCCYRACQVTILLHYITSPKAHFVPRGACRTCWLLRRQLRSAKHDKQELDQPDTAQHLCPAITKRTLHTLALTCLPPTAAAHSAASANNWAAGPCCSPTNKTVP
jgi:hypothetical protein